ncbi:hypothetical protein PP404_24445 [Mycobacteroides abscessus]|nr:hypothetical protein [Mycobacteroides abscessus]MDM2177343.1 hypothetical protein [Mycobacteroides abscessus]MDM2208271.1 hypothetical protein [Mycobacteroides abscessus]MDM2211819.1 hypothetical protein [Mycobacteroides abscessus]MDM2217778.1 hypothetical protein [Mycobacteroides abscessus]
MSKPERIEFTSRIGWVLLDQMKVSPVAQRALNQAWVDRLAAEFNPDVMGMLHVSYRDGWYYVIDGQHRKSAAIQWMGSDQQVQCHIYEGLTSADEADLFLRLNSVKAQTPMSKYKVALTAGRPIETDIDRIARSAGLVIGLSKDLEEIGCVTALVNTYNKSGPGSLAFALRVIRDAYGYDGFQRDPIAALALIKDRYGDAIEEDKLIMRLNKIGVVELRREARKWRDTTGNPGAQCFAHAMIIFYNRGSGKRVDPWWNLGIVGVA